MHIDVYLYTQQDEKKEWLWCHSVAHIPLRKRRGVQMFFFCGIWLAVEL